MMMNPLSLVKVLVKGRRLVQDPTRLDEVIDIADTLTTPAVVQPMVDAIARDPAGARALAERPRVHIDLPALRRLPPGTLGREFADHMDHNGLDPAALPTRAAGDALAYVPAHLFETHDIWHVVTGFDTDAAGELGLQAFYLAQLPGRLAPVLLAIGMVNTVLYAFDDRTRRMDEITRGWQLGRVARPLFGTRWDDLWDAPLPAVRARFGLPVRTAAGDLRGAASPGVAA